MIKSRCQVSPNVAFSFKSNQKPPESCKAQKIRLRLDPALRGSVVTKVGVNWCGNRWCHPVLPQKLITVLVIVLQTDLFTFFIVFDSTQSTRFWTELGSKRSKNEWMNEWMKMNENIYCLRTYRIGTNRNISRYLNSEKYALVISLRQSINQSIYLHSNQNVVTQ